MCRYSSHLLLQILAARAQALDFRPHEHLLANAKNTRAAFQAAATKEGMLDPTHTEEGYAVSFDGWRQVKRITEGDFAYLATPSLGKKWIFKFTFDGVKWAKHMFRTPLIVNCPSVRPASGMARAAQVLSYGAFNDKHLATLEKGFEKSIDFFHELSDSEIKDPHTGEELPVECFVSLDGAAIAVIANTSGYTSNFPLYYTTQGESGVKDPLQYGPLNVDYEFQKLVEEVCGAPRCRLIAPRRAPRAAERSRCTMPCVACC